MATSTVPLSALERLTSAVQELRRRAVELEEGLRAEIEAVAPENRDSARNLVHYLALRQQDIRDLQTDLAGLGLSSLGRLEGHVLATLESVLAVLHALAGREYERPADAAAGVNPPTAASLLSEHARLLLGQRPLRRPVRIMVTMSSEAALEYTIVKELLAAGMNVMRINCAHDGPREWKAMIANLRRAELELGATCQVQADLPGPKLRTGAVAAGARVIKLKPERDPLGRVLRPARVWLTPANEPEPAPSEATQTVRVGGTALAAAREGDVLSVVDSRSRRRKLRITAARGRSLIAEAKKTVYLTDGTRVELRRERKPVAEGRVEGVPEVSEPIRLRKGDVLTLTRAEEPGHPARLADDGRVVPAHIHCTLSEAFDAAQAGDPVFFDDGRIGGVVSGNDGQRIEVEITDAPDPRGSKLRGEQGVNFPESRIALPSLTAGDIAALEAMADEVDMVAVSFVQHPRDLALLEEHLQRLGAAEIGVVLKVENRAAFENLPNLLLAALRFRPVGVMVARGDLAIEVGFERLSEVQEEILWLCEAAHVPVIWATQVLEGMAKTGSPTRAEVSDAAMSGRAECVMLNKGPHIVKTVEFLSGVLERMHAHQAKKTAMLRKLSISESVLPPPVRGS
jgi:pyruvate kinase